MNKKTPEPIDVLINILHLIDSKDGIDLKNKTYVHPLIEALVYLADECFINDDNYNNIQRLRNAGFDAGPLEQDSFGWLTGWIQLNKRKEHRILFG